MYRNYINQEFMSYLNRHLTGIALLKDKISKIKISYYLSDAFSNHACRFYIKEDFIDFDKLSKNDQASANEFLYNSDNSSGNQFVSFIYEGNRDRDLSVDVINSFIYHYMFAQNLFEGFIKNTLQDNCILEIASLEDEPFFNYINRFISYAEHGDIKRFTHRYFETNKRSFDFDCRYHNILKEAAVEAIDGDTISDIELCEAGGGKIEDIRRVVLNENIPFTWPPYLMVIDKISIDRRLLKKVMENYTPSAYENISPQAILKSIQAREDKEDERKLREQLVRDAEISIDDYIYVREQCGRDYRVGKVKTIDVDSTDYICVRYVSLNKNLSESKRTVIFGNEASLDEIQFYLRASEAQKNKIKTDDQLISYMKENGVKNPSYKPKNK